MAEDILAEALIGLSNHGIMVFSVVNWDCDSMIIAFNQLNGIHMINDPGQVLCTHLAHTSDSAGPSMHK